MSERVALITGGASGIGRACAQSLAGAGAKVAIADTDELNGAQTARALDCSFISANLGLRDGCRDAVERTVDAHGGLDILVNNAGFQSIAAIPDFEEDTWDAMMSVMLTAPFLLTKYAWKWLKRSGNGRIINVGSVHSLVASPFKVGYVAAKHGLVGLTRVVALEGADHGITCNAVCPAYVRTPLVEKQIADQARTRGLDPEQVERQVFLENVAVKRLLEPEDVASHVTYLSSEAAWGITGSVQTIDLGWTAR